jgi:uncharacterized protein
MTKVLGSKLFNDVNDELCIEFINYVSDIVCIPEYQLLKNYTHHYYTNRYQHCLNVAWYSFLMSRKLHLNVRSCTRGAMLHDFYLYENIHTKEEVKKHIQTHPKVALENAQRFIRLDDVEIDCIVHHMWPRVKGKPKTKEGYIVTVADKYAASLEVCSHPYYAFPKWISKTFQSLQNKFK